MQLKGKERESAALRNIYGLLAVKSMNHLAGWGEVSRPTCRAKAELVSPRYKAIIVDLGVWSVYSHSLRNRNALKYFFLLSILILSPWK